MAKDFQNPEEVAPDSETTECGQQHHEEYQALSNREGVDLTHESREDLVVVMRPALHTSGEGGGVA